MKDLGVFKTSISNGNMPDGLSIHLKALWLDAHGDWQGAHDLIDQLPDKDSASLHAYLHRKEGDQWNADYWYSRARRERFEGSLQEEWEFLARYFLEKG